MIAKIIFLFVWLYGIHILSKSKIPAWKFIWGSCGLFVLMMIFVRPIATEPLAKIVAAIAGVVGKLTGTFAAYFKYGVIFVDSDAGAISLLIDFECSGVLEIMAFTSLLCFFEAYDVFERFVVAVIGNVYLIFANALRIMLICFVIHFFGMESYYIAHTFIGRIFFYGFSIVLYFIVFTKVQIVRQKVGGFSYGTRS